MHGSRDVVACMIAGRRQLGGGSVGAGERWQYSPLANKVAEAGALALVMSYTLFPEVLVPQMVDEVRPVRPSVAKSLGVRGRAVSPDSLD